LEEDEVARKQREEEEQKQLQEDIREEEDRLAEAKKNAPSTVEIQSFSPVSLITCMYVPTKKLCLPIFSSCNMQSTISNSSNQSNKQAYTVILSILPMIVIKYY
jgi:hypothetical protein